MKKENKVVKPEAVELENFKPKPRKGSNEMETLETEPVTEINPFERFKLESLSIEDLQKLQELAKATIKDKKKIKRSPEEIKAHRTRINNTKRFTKFIQRFQSEILAGEIYMNEDTINKVESFYSSIADKLLENQGA